MCAPRVSESSVRCGRSAEARVMQPWAQTTQPGQVVGGFDSFWSDRIENLIRRAVGRGVSTIAYSTCFAEYHGTDAVRLCLVRRRVLFNAP